jgi:plastocyanin
MRRAARIVLASVAALWVTAAPAAADPASVSVRFEEFGPRQVDVLPGETVVWTNVSERRHTVNADDGSFASGDLFDGDTFTHGFDAVGAYPYHCTVHPGMTGEIDVRRVTLGPLPTAQVPLGSPVQFTGRTADAATPVRIERAAGEGFETIATATPAPDGSWSTTVAANRTGDYRAAGGDGASDTRRLLVSSRKIRLRATRRGVVVTVTPALPYGRVVLQQDLRERFGWWPAQRGSLDYLSQASFRVARPAVVRAILVDVDGWSPVATSAVLRLGGARSRHPVTRTRPQHHDATAAMPGPHSGM